MEHARPLSKVIAGETVNYDRIRDVIYTDRVRVDTPFTRNQTGRSVDICFEVTDACNAQCANCFSESGVSRHGIYLPHCLIRSTIEAQHQSTIRVCITGGEPFMHPDIASILRLPGDFPDIGFVVSTNGMSRPDIDSILLDNGWLVAVSIHGNREAHNSYVRVDGFDVVTTRIRVLSDLGVPLHLYSVINDRMTNRDIDWLFRFTDEVRANFLRFIVPRPHGRTEQLINWSLVEYACSHCGKKANLVSKSSNARFYDKYGNQGRSN